MKPELAEPTRPGSVRHFVVSFEMECDGRDPCTEDIRDALGEFFEEDVLQGRITNFKVVINHAKEFDGGQP